jgi:hypothetical protein
VGPLTTDKQPSRLMQWIEDIRAHRGNDMIRPVVWPLLAALILIAALGLLVRLILQALLVIAG